MSSRPYFIVNPRSAGGETGKRWDLHILPQITRRFPQARWVFTSSQGEASRLAARAWQEGADLVVAVGGDGTVNEVINGLMGELLGPDDGLPAGSGADWGVVTPLSSRPAFGHIPRGTGCDFARSIDVPRELEGALDVLAGARIITADVGHITFTRREGGEGQRYFLNLGGCGANGEVVERVNKSGKSLGGFLSFFVASVQTNLAYRRYPVEVQVDAEPARTIDLSVLFVCNAQYCGGGMRVGVDARMNDGRFKVVEVASTNVVSSMLNASRLYSGNMSGFPGARVYDARKIRLTSSEQVPVECDGEQPGILPAEWSLIPAALDVRVGRKAVVG